MDRRAKHVAAICALYGAIAAFFCSPLFEHPNGLGISDWDQHLFYYAAVLKNVVEYRQLPFWNAWYCGGNVLWANPQIALLSPVYPLTSLMSLALAMKVNILLHYVVGLVGMHVLLTRIFRLSNLALIVYLGSVFTLCGAMALHLNAGHSVFLPAFYLPLLLYCLLLTMKTGMARHALAGGAVFALIIFNGGLHIVPMAIVGVGSVAVVAATVRRTWRPILLALLLGVSGFAYAAPKLLPVASFVQGDRFWDTRTPTGHPDFMTAGMVLRSYVDPYQTRSMKLDDLQRHGWYEYGNHIGALAVVLLVSSLLWIVTTRKQPEEGWLGISLAVTTAVLLALSAGEFSAIAPAALATYVPIFSSFRIPSRYTVEVALLAPLTIAWVARSLATPLASGATRRFLTIAFALAAFHLLLSNRAQFYGVFPLAPLEQGVRPPGGSGTLLVDRTSSPYGPDSPMLRALASGQSFYNCYESLQLRHTADADHPIVFDDGRSRIFDTRFSPNRVEFSAAVGPEASRIVLNQNDAPGWQSPSGTVAPDPQSGSPSLVLRPGEAGRFSFVFVPPGLWLGLAIFAAAVVGSAVLWRRRLAPVL